MPTTKPKRKVRPKRTARPPSRQQLLEHDPWHFDRGHPVFEAMINWLIRYDDVCYYAVDWRAYLFGASCPGEEADLKRSPSKPVRDRDPICGSMSVRYNATKRRGGGYLEREAMSWIARMYGCDYLSLVRVDTQAPMGRWAEHSRLPAPDQQPVMRPSEAVLADMRHGYESEVTGHAHMWDRTRPKFRRRQRRTPRWGFDRLMREVGITPRRLAVLDRMVDTYQTKHSKQTNPQEKPCPSPSRSSSTRPRKRSAGSSMRNAGARSPRRPVSVARTRSTTKAGVSNAASSSSAATRKRSRPGSSNPPALAKRARRAKQATRTTSPRSSGRRVPSAA